MVQEKHLGAIFGGNVNPKLRLLVVCNMEKSFGDMTHKIITIEKYLVDRKNLKYGVGEVKKPYQKKEDKQVNMVKAPSQSSEEKP